MNDYIICVRNIDKGKFGNEPGTTYFLDIPSSKKNIEIENIIKKKSDWFNLVLKEAVVGKDLNGNDYGDVLVFVHGYNNNQEIVLNRHRKIKKSLEEEGYEGVVVSFDWPSADSALNYLEDRSDAKYTAIKLVDDCIKVFTLMQEDSCQINLHILAHSTGAYVVREAFDDADDRPRVASTNWIISQIMFIGADISAKSMSESNAKSSSLYRHCVRLTNFSNPYDSVLKLSNVKRVGVAPRVGRVGLPKDTPPNAVNVNCGRYYDENKNILKSSHSWYMGNDSFSKDIFLTILGDIDRYSIPTRNLLNGNLHLK